MSHTATLSHKQALTKLIGQFLFMLQSRSVRHAHLHTATLSRDKVARENRRCDIGLTGENIRQQTVKSIGYHANVETSSHTYSTPTLGYHLRPALAGSRGAAGSLMLLLNMYDIMFIPSRDVR